MSIYNDKRTPYFYIIRHVPSGKKYAGCRYGKGCHPDELLQENGYHTSSSIVKRMIEDDGLESFLVVEIVSGVDDVRKYENDFLLENNCAESNTWINKHNNRPNFGSKDFMKKARKTNLQKYGNESPMKTDTIREKYKNTLMENYGVKHNSHIPHFSEKVKKTLLKNYGVDHNGKILKTCVFCGVEDKAAIIHRHHNNHCKQNPDRTKVKYTLHKRIVCEYCGKDIASSVYKKHHGKKCKEYTE